MVNSKPYIYSLLNTAAALPTPSKQIKIIKKIYKRQWDQGINQSLRIWLGTQLSLPTPELGPLQAGF